MTDRAAPLVPYEIDTTILEPALRHEAWQERFGPVNDIAVSPEVRRDLRARSAAWTLGDWGFTHSVTPAMELNRTRRQCARDGLSHVVLRVMRKGASVSRIGDRVYGGRPGSIVVETLATAYGDSFEQSDWVALYVPRASVPEVAAGIARLGPGPVEGASPRLLASYLASLPEHLRGATVADLPAIAEATRGMVAACLLGHLAPGSVTPEDAALAQRARVTEVVLENLGSPRLTPDRIAALSGVPRRTLNRLFEADGGIAAHVRAARLERVAAALADPRCAQEPIGTLAQRWGFHCQASFNRTFRAAYGCTPGEARLAAAVSGRRIVRAGGGQRQDAANLAEFLSLSCGHHSGS